MFKIKPEKIDSIEVIEILCPVCGDEGLLEPLEGRQWECVNCGVQFETEY